MNKYESIIIINPSLEEQGIKEVITKFTDLINSNGKVENVDEMGRRKLAYEIQKHSEGYYVVYTFEANPEPVSYTHLFKAKIRTITSRSNAMNMETRFLKLKQVIRGWVNYFEIENMKKIVQKLDEWIRRRIRMCYWKQWKKIKTKHDNLVKLGINNQRAWEYANTRKSYWRMSDTPFMHQALNNKTLGKLGYTSLTSVYS